MRPPVAPAAPIGHLDEALRPWDDLVLLRRAGESLHRHIEELVDLRPGELGTLAAVDREPDDAGGGERAGRPTDPTTLTALQGLLRRGLLTGRPDRRQVRRRDRPDESDAAAPVRLRLTGRGSVSLQQAEGLRILAVAVPLDALDPDRRDALLALSSVVATTLHPHVLPVTSPALPGS